MLCKIGNVEVWRLLEIHGPFLSPSELFPNAGADVSKIIENLAPGSVCPKTDRLILPIQGYLLKTGTHNILVDSCVGNDKTIENTPDWHKRSSNRFMAALEAAGLTVEDVDYVLCTHLHLDHIGWNTRLEDGRWVPTFPNAKYLLPSADEKIHRVAGSNAYVESVLPVIEAGQVELVQAGHKIGDVIELLPTPGHTEGHVSILIKSASKEAVITGDAIHSTAQCWHPEWHFKFDADGVRAQSSRVELLERCCETDCLVLGNHFSLPSIGKVRAKNDAFCWIDPEFE